MSSRLPGCAAGVAHPNSDLQRAPTGSSCLITSLLVDLVEALDGHTLDDPDAARALDRARRHVAVFRHMGILHSPCGADG